MIYWLQLRNRLWSRNQNLAHKRTDCRSISKYKYCVNRSRDISRGYFSKNLKIDKTGGVFKRKEVKENHFFIHTNKFPSLHVWNDSPSHIN